MKAKTILINHDNEEIKNEGDSALVIQATKDALDHLNVNMDWSFDRSWSPSDIKSMLGCFLSSLEEVFGEKMVTEIITHWGEQTGKMVKNDKGQAMLYFKSRGMDFKKGNVK